MNREPLSLDTVREQIDAMFTPQERRRAVDWANSAEGREFLDAHRQALRAIPLPHEREPMA